MADPQWEFPWPPHEHCYSHGAHEPLPAEGAYCVCHECFHVFPSDEALVQDFLDNAPDDFDKGMGVTAEHVYFCPHCLHDF